MKTKPSGTKHDNYEVLNLVGYGLAKFEKDLIQELGFKTKTALYEHLIKRRLAKTVGTLKNRQDLFNPLVRGGRVGCGKTVIDIYTARSYSIHCSAGSMSPDMRQC